METYGENRERVCEIYGIDPHDPNYSTHHIVTRQDRKRGMIDQDFKIDKKANLIPLTVREHRRTHTMIKLIERGMTLREASRVTLRRSG